MRIAVQASLVILIAISTATVAPAQVIQHSPETQYEQQWPTMGAPGAAPATIQEEAIESNYRARKTAKLMISLILITRSMNSYVQVFNPKKTEIPILTKDYYYLGQADLSGGKPMSYRSMLSPSDQIPKKGLAEENFKPLGFVRMAYIDREGFDRQHYSFNYVGQEFLGEIRCIAFDVKPLPDSGNGRFFGRIWAEDKSYAVVRFNGIFLPVHDKGGWGSHFDSWRLNVQPDLWLPAYAFAEETDLKIHKVEIKYLNDNERLRFKAQTRFWGYDLRAAAHEQEFSGLTIEGSTRIDEKAAESLDHDQSPRGAQRQWQSQAENNVLSALERTGMLARAGEVDKTLDTVVNNLGGYKQTRHRTSGALPCAHDCHV